MACPGVTHAMNRPMVFVVTGAALVVVGIIAIMITEPAGEDGSDASGGVANVSEDTRPYLWPGIIVIALGIVLAIFGLRWQRRST